MRTNVRASGPSHVTHEGGVAKRLNPIDELRRTVMCCLLWEDTFYESGEDVSARMAGLVAACKPEDVAAIAVEARSRFHLRHAPLFLLVELFKCPEARVAAGKALAECIQRADEPAEFLALYWKDGRKPVPAAAKKALAKALGKFNPYQIAKWKGDGNAVKLRDVLRLLHPKPSETQAEAFRALARNELARTGTWEDELSAGKDKHETWTRLLSERKLGALALLRNLRNMQEAKVEDSLIRQALAAMKPDRVLPFRFIAAARYAPKFEPELEAAMFRNLGDAEKLHGETTLLVDVSGSMNDRLSEKGDMLRVDAAIGLAVLLRELCETVDIICYDTQGYQMPPRRGFALRDAMRVGGGGTNTGAAIRTVDHGQRIICITDEQAHDTVPGPKGRGYMLNVGTYKPSVAFGAWVSVSGWSERVVDFIRESERA